MASVKRVEYKSGRVVYRIVICQGYDKKGNKLVKNLTYSVNQSATPKQQEREAKKYAMDMEDKLKYGYDYNAEKMSFEDFAYKWLESVKDNIAYGTYAGYKQVLESRIIPYFKGDKIAHIKTPHIEAFYRTLVDDYSAGTIKRFANVLNLIFKTAKRYSMIENNPCQDAQKPKRKDEDEGLKFFTPKQTSRQSVPRWSKATGQHPGGAGLLRFPTKQREAFYQSAKEVYREINYTET